MSPSLSADRARSISVVVLTTLGLGDIVPMTKASRLCVALEAITGITLAGYF
ncbi:MAG: ion channel [Afipia sp.]